MNVLIVGGGQVGSYLASLLIKNGNNVKVVENREKQLKAMQRDLPEGVVVTGGFTDPAVLEKAGIHESDVVVAVTPTDEGNLVVSTLAHFEFGVKRVIARANNPKNTWMFTPEMGVDVGLTEADLMAHVVAEEISVGNMMTLLKLNKERCSLVQETIHPDSSVIGKAIRELDLPEDCVLVAVIRKDETIIPRGNTVLLVDDEIMAVAATSEIGALAAILNHAI
jgi:trk system potassium uptake protein TrkA